MPDSTRSPSPLQPWKMPKACDACRSRKLKCSNRGLTRALLLPICDNCVRSGIVCVSSETPRRRPRSGKIVDALRSGSPLQQPPGPPTQRGRQESNDCHSIPWAWPGYGQGGILGKTPFTAPASMPTSPPDASPQSHPLQLQTLPMQQHHPHQLMLEQARQGFAFFMNTIYATWPVIRYEDVSRRLEAGPDTWDLDFCILGHALALLHDTYAGVFAPPTDGTTRIVARVAVINQLRATCGYDYAATATADTVIVSFTLFVACIVMGQDQRALLYLSEARTLADFASARVAAASGRGRTMDRHNKVERMRTQRLKALLFITATATALLSGDTAWRTDVPPSLRIEDLTSWYGDADVEDVDGMDGGGGDGQDEDGPSAVQASNDLRDLDQFAVRQLQQMTRMYMVAGARSSGLSGLSGLSGPGPSSISDDALTNTISNVSLSGSPTVRIITADLSITQLWFSCDRRLKQADVVVATTSAPDDLDPPDIGRKALAWARSLSQSELRAVGLGKMVEIVENMVHLCRRGAAGHQTAHSDTATAEVAWLAGDLMAAIGTADYELRYAATLAQCAAVLQQTASTGMGGNLGMNMDMKLGVDMCLHLG